MPERNNREIIKPVLIDTELGSIRNDIALKDTTVRPDATIMATNFQTVNNAQRIAQAFGVIGNGMQDMAKGEIDKARMDYAERKHAEAEAERASQKAEAEQRRQDVRNARQTLFHNLENWHKLFTTTSSNAMNAEGATLETYDAAMTNLYSDVTKGLNQNEEDTIGGSIMDMINSQRKVGFQHFKQKRFDIASNEYHNILNSPNMPEATRLQAIADTDTELIESGFATNEDVVNLRIQSIKSQFQNLAQNGDEDAMQDLEGFLQTNNFLNEADQDEYLLQGEINSLQKDAKKAKYEKVSIAESDTFEATYPQLKDRDDKARLSNELFEVQQEDTDGSLLGRATRSGKIKAYQQRIAELEAIDSQYARPVKEVGDLIDMKIKETAADGQLTSGEAGVGLDINGGSVLLMGTERTKLDTEVINKLTSWAKENNIPPSDPRIAREAYRLYGEIGKRWGLDDYNPEKILKRPLNEVDPFFYKNNAQEINKIFYTKIEQERKTSEDTYRIINDLLPLTDDPKQNWDIRRMHTSIYNYVVQQDRKKEAEEARRIAMSEKEVANQMLSDSESTYYKHLGLGYYDNDVVLSNNEDTIFDSIGKGLSAIGHTIFSSRDTPEYSFQYDVPYSLNEIKAADEFLKSQSNGKQSLKNLNIEDATMVIERLRTEGEINAQKLVNNILTDHNVKLENDNATLKNMMIQKAGESNTKISLGQSSELENILKGNKSKNFVKRILNPDKYPVLNNSDGSYSTHSMAWGEANGKYYVYPTVVQKNGKMIRLSDDEAWDYAWKNNELMEFDSEDEAAWFSENYKQYWEMINKHPSRKKGNI